MRTTGNIPFNASIRLILIVSVTIEQVDRHQTYLDVLSGSAQLRRESTARTDCATSDNLVFVPC